MAPLPTIALVLALTVIGAVAGDLAGALISARAAVGKPAYEARRYRQRFASGDVIVVVDAGERRYDAQRVLLNGSVGR